MSNVERENAQIVDTMLGIEDHGILTFMLHLEMNGGSSGIGYGGYRLDGKRKDGKVTSFCADSIRGVLETVGVDKWEDLKGKFIRIESEGWGGRCLRIGHITKDKWLDLKELAGNAS